MGCRGRQIRARILVIVIQMKHLIAQILNARPLPGIGRSFGLIEESVYSPLYMLRGRSARNSSSNRVAASHLVTLTGKPKHCLTNLNLGGLRVHITQREGCLQPFRRIC